MSYEIENRKQYQNLMDSLALGDRLPPKQWEALDSWAKAKKVKRPPANPAAAPKKPKAESTRTKNAGTVCKEKDCDREASSLGLCKKHHTAAWRKLPENAEKTRLAGRKHAAKARYLKLVAAIGEGFHPDVKGEDYAELPEGITAERVDSVVDGAADLGLDVYALAGVESPDEATE